MAVLAAAPVSEAVYLEGPPSGHTGGFGGDTCHTCHFENDLDAPGGSLTLTGVPDTFDPSATYRITVTLERPGMERAGFQLAARVGEGDGAGGAAGVLQAPGGDERVQTVLGANGVTYAQHTESGTALTGVATASWTVEWSPPPASGATAVVFHAAANAANYDASEFGDFIYTESATTRAAERRAATLPTRNFLSSDLVIGGGSDRIHDLDARKAREVTVRSGDAGPVFQGQCRKMGVHDHRTLGLALFAGPLQQLPHPPARLEKLHIWLVQPRLDQGARFERC